MKRPLGIFALVIVISALITFSSQVTAQVSPALHVPESSLVAAKVDPVYPPLARQARVEGQVILQLQISKSGDIEDIRLVSGHPMLAPAAIEAVRKWKYKPFLLNGEPVPVETKVTVSFTLADKPPAEGVAGDAPGGVPAGQPGSVISTPAPDTPKIATPQRVRVSAGVAQKLVKSRVTPAYPAEARDQRIQGVVLLNITIDKEGNVYKVDLVSGPAQLAPAAMEAVKQWKYQPYLLNGTPVEVESQVQVNFTLAY